jgi:hypothetical protein
MIPDLRFIIGAVVSIALLTVTAFGLGAATYLRHQTKVGPLEASRLLAFGPSDRRLMGHDNPFAGLPPSPHGMRPPADIPIVQAVEVIPAPADAVIAVSPGDPDTVDERAVVDPPLSPDEDPILMATPPDADTDPSTAAEPAGPATPQAPTAQTRSEPDVPAASEEAASAAPASSTAVEPSSVPAPATEAASVIPASPETAPVASAPSESVSVAPVLTETTSVVAAPPAAMADPEPVGSVTVTPTADTAAEEPAESRPKSRKAKAKAPASRAKAKAPAAKAKAKAPAPQAKAKATAQKARARPRRQARPVPSNASTGYGVMSDGLFGAPMSRQTGQSRSLWSGF